MPIDIDKCRLESAEKWGRIDVTIQKLKDDIKTVTHRLDEQATVINDIQQLSTSVSVLANNMQQMLEEQRSQNKRLQALEMKPVKRWDSAVDKIISVITAALVGALLIKLGLPG